VKKKKKKGVPMGSTDDEENNRPLKLGRGEVELAEIRRSQAVDRVEGVSYFSKANREKKHTVSLLRIGLIRIPSRKKDDCGF